jgi:cytochrome b involved in lipid metabolism
MSSLKTTLAKVILIPLAAALSLVAWGPAAVPAQAVAAPSSITASSTQVQVAAVKKYKMSTVKKHKTKKSCWTVVGTGVYDLTKWVKKHPGGQSRILAMCGKNATKAFRAQHGSTGAAARALAKYKIGKLA